MFDMENPLNPTENNDLRQIVYEKIKRAIVENYIEPGDKLSEIDLAEKLSVSRTPVREAIRQLAKTGLVTLNPRKGAYVTVPTLEDARALYDLREHLEAFAVSLLAVDPPEELVGFRELFRSLLSGGKLDTGAFIKEDKRFHAFLYESTSNKFLRSSLMELADLVNLYRPFVAIDRGIAEEVSESHIRIIDAIMARNPEGAQLHMREHIRMNKAMIEEHLRSRSDASKKVL